ncbi:hypothetical protein EV657_11447 [Rhodovulum visakhapatnamense]|uniref:Uncharacterized protein n=1 Tax=Rhodovulum visakhapatnamense TaxID=364297 RepID=A0A4R8FQJ4_9RHOB|nr:hypothetical protein EV657_11447 [Rhodovulum visakhapatnamense]
MKEFQNNKNMAGETPRIQLKIEIDPAEVANPLQNLNLTQHKS